MCVVVSGKESKRDECKRKEEVRKEEGQRGWEGVRSEGEGEGELYSTRVSMVPSYF